MSEAWLPLNGIHGVVLADLGADVIKVEPPRGDPGRSYVPVQCNTGKRNKRSLALDLVELGFDDGEIADLRRNGAVCG